MGVEANSFTYTYPDVSPPSNSANSRVVTVNFPSTTSQTAAEVDDLDLTYKVPAPIWGGTAETYFYAPQYTGNVVWTVSSGGQKLNGLFEAGTAYTAKVTLTAASGYTLGPNAFRHENALLISSLSSGTVTIRFRATGAGQDTVISGPLDLTNLLPAPITGATPRMDFPGGNYSGIAAWTTAGGFPVTIFEVGTVYTAVVTLTPAPGYSFPASLEVTHGGIPIPIDNFTGEPRQGAVTFPATGILTLYSGPFSGSSESGGDNDSAIDVIRMAKAADHPILYLQLSPRSKETVTPGSSKDIGNTAEGLVLEHKGLSTDNSPPKVAIDGGKRIIELDTSDGSLITVKTGVTLTLRNLTIRETKTNSKDLVVEDGGQVNYETGVSIIKFVAPPFSGYTTDTTDSAIDAIRAAMPGTGSLELELSPGIEGVNLNGTSDLGTGLVLDSTTSPAEVIIKGNGRTVQMDAGSASGSIITVGSGVTLTLQNITFTGSSGNTKPLIKVATGGKLILEDGAVITDNKGAGVLIDGGVVEMNNGARIENNGQSGVVAENGGSFTMNGGTISGNTAAGEGGGVSIDDASSFTMEGGTISRNTTAYLGGGVYVSSGGTFSKTRGIIYGSDGGPDANTANSSSTAKSHAVCFRAGSVTKRRALTAGEGVPLNGATADGWD
jgi:hypothetical protein